MAHCIVSKWSPFQSLLKSQGHFEVKLKSAFYEEFLSTQHSFSFLIKNWFCIFVKVNLIFEGPFTEILFWLFRHSDLLSVAKFFQSNFWEKNFSRRKNFWKEILNQALWVVRVLFITSWTQSLFKASTTLNIKFNLYFHNERLCGWVTRWRSRTF